MNHGGCAAVEGWSRGNGTGGSRPSCAPKRRAAAAGDGVRLGKLWAGSQAVVAYGTDQSPSAGEVNQPQQVTAKDGMGMGEVQLCNCPEEACALY